MLASVSSAAVHGIDAYDVSVEVDVAFGLPKWTIVGLPANAVKESLKRVTAALANSGFVVPPRRVTVNLAPADVAKHGTAFDLPIALGYLLATAQFHSFVRDPLVVVGELGLDGAIRPVRGALSIARRVAQLDGTTLVIPPGNAAEAGLVSRVRLAAPSSLGALVAQLRRGILDPPEPFIPAPRLPDDVDFADVVGQESAKRALEIAAAGGHAVLMVGPPGAGKTMLARRLPSILPALTEDEALEVTAIHSVAGLLSTDAPLVAARPFRAPHHTASAAGLIGGGSNPRPGEVSLAHHGVLFLDEMQEIPRSVLDALRQPLEDGRVTISRALTTVSYPARFTLVGAMNPCPCGHAGDDRCECTCSPADIGRHRARLSGPLLDRIDMHVTVPPVPLRQLGVPRARESSRDVRQRVEAARARQHRRWAPMGAIACNGRVPGRWVETRAPIDADARELLATSAEQMGLSARGYHRVLRMACTIADLGGDDIIRAAYVAEALRFRLRATGRDAKTLPTLVKVAG